MGLAAFNRMRRIREEAEKVEALEKSESKVVVEPIKEPVSKESLEVDDKKAPTSEEIKNTKVEGTKKPSTSSVSRKRN